jgi:hypothetical protein
MSLAMCDLWWVSPLGYWVQSVFGSSLWHVVVLILDFPGWGARSAVVILLESFGVTAG